MAALHELSVRLAILGRSLPLSTMKASASSVAVLTGHQSSSASRSSPLFLLRLPVDWCRQTVKGTGIASSRCPLWLRGSDPDRCGPLNQSCGKRSRLDIVSPVIHREFHLQPANAFHPNRSSEMDGAQVILQDGIDVLDSPGSDSHNVAEEQVMTKEGLKHETKRLSNYLAMSDQQLFSDCRMDTFRASGPGGQHRNKTESAVRLTHTPTGLVAQAADDRSQHNNRSLALVRLRQTIALEIRDSVELIGYVPSAELVRILPVGGAGRKKGNQKIGPNHPEFVQGMKYLIDLMWATEGSVSDAAKILGLSTGALSKLITSNNLLWQGINKLRAAKGLKPLR